MAYNSKYTGADIEQMFDRTEPFVLSMKVYDLMAGRSLDSVNITELLDAADSGKPILMLNDSEGNGYVRATGCDVADDYIFVFFHISQMNTYNDRGIDLNIYISFDRETGGVDEWVETPISEITKLKTINGQSLLGSGNITIQGGSGGGNAAYPIVNHGTSDTTFTLSPNTFHVWDEVSSLTLTLGSETAGVANEFLFQFASGATATSLTLPDDIKWANDTPPTIAENMIYQVSILNGMASVLEFSNAPSVTIINFTIRNYSCTAIEGMTWEQWVLSEYNTCNCSFMGNNIQRTGEIVGTSYTTYVTKTDVITSDFAYTLIPMT